MEYIFVWAIMGVITGCIATMSKGRSFWGWFFYGMMIPIVAIPHALLISPNPEGLNQAKQTAGMKKCPHCAEYVQQDAQVCRYCGRSLVPALTS